MYLPRGIRVTIPGLFALCFGALAIARADSVSLTGTRYEAVPAASLGGRCDPVPTLIVNSSVGVVTGTSNFGDFTVDQTACLHTPFPAAITDGVFTWTFDDGDTLGGTWSGLDTRVTIPTGHLLTINEDYVVTGGTGDFFDATGTISETGTALSTGVSAVANYTFEGTITGPDLSSAPEPPTLALLGTGLAVVAATFRRTRKSSACPRLFPPE